MEIKNLIYKFTFGGNLIHVIQNPEKGAAKFKSTICHATISEEEAQKNFDDESTHKWYVPANDGRHERCRFQNGTTFRESKEMPQTLSLRPLRCCRQIYNEAHHVPYSTNTFSCADPITLGTFFKSLAQGNNHNHLAVRSLFIEMVYSRGEDDPVWMKALASCARQLKKLQNVSISIEWHNLGFYLGPRFSILEGRGLRGDDGVISDVLMLRKLPLKTATMVISDQWADNRWMLTNVLEVTHRWTLEEKKKWAHYVREVLLQ